MLKTNPLVYPDLYKVKYDESVRLSVTLLYRITVEFHWMDCSICRLIDVSLNREWCYVSYGFG